MNPTEEIEIIDSETIEKACILGFLKYLEDKDSIMVDGKNKDIARIDIEKYKNFTKQLFTIEIDLAKLLPRLFNNERVKIPFNAKYELFEKIGSDFSAIVVDTSFSFGYLSKREDNSLNFEIDGDVSFKANHI